MQANEVYIYLMPCFRSHRCRLMETPPRLAHPRRLVSESCPKKFVFLPDSTGSVSSFSSIVDSSVPRSFISLLALVFLYAARYIYITHLAHLAANRGRLVREPYRPCPDSQATLPHQYPYYYLVGPQSPKIKMNGGISLTLTITLIQRSVVDRSHRLGLFLGYRKARTRFHSQLIF